jgi:nitrate/nitrite-specific signal transduction histidine kinase
LAVKTLNRQTAETVQVQTLLRWRWIILFASIMFVAAIEWFEHQELELHLAREFLIYGMVIPIGTWFLLTLLARHMARQVALTDELEDLHQFSRQLAYYQDRDELARFMTRFPGAILPVERVTLFQYDHLKATLEFVDEWNADGRVGESVDYAPTVANVQYVWNLSKEPGLHQACSCPLIAEANDRGSVRHICLPLVCDTMLVGLLRLQCAPNQSVSDKQIQFLNSIASHLALALALSIAFPRQVTAAQRTERRQLAYELHDSLAQQIGYLHLGLDRLADDERLENAAWLQNELERLREVASDSYLQVRNNLTLLYDQGETDLVPTVESYIRSIEPHVPYKIEFRSSGTAMSLGPLATRRVFGLIQESLNNIQNHAQARQTCVALQWYASRLEITLADDGVGFDVTAAPTAGHYGLSILRERVQELHGEMSIKSVAGEGTTVQFEIPILKF